MAFAVAALRAEGEMTMRDSDAAGVSYPTFFRDLDRIAIR
jgi:5-enolpyruvylshikimate-3-phosphate synthase